MFTVDSVNVFCLSQRQEVDHIQCTESGVQSPVAFLCHASQPRVFYVPDRWLLGANKKQQTRSYLTGVWQGEIGKHSQRMDHVCRSCVGPRVRILSVIWLWRQWWRQYSPLRAGGSLVHNIYMPWSGQLSAHCSQYQLYNVIACLHLCDCFVLSINLQLKFSCFRWWAVFCSLL